MPPPISHIVHASLTHRSCIIHTSSMNRPMPGTHRSSSSDRFCLSNRHRPIPDGYRPIHDGYRPIHDGYRPMPDGYRPMPDGYRQTSVRHWSYPTIFQDDRRKEGAIKHRELLDSVISSADASGARPNIDRASADV